MNKNPNNNGKPAIQNKTTLSQQLTGTRLVKATSGCDADLTDIRLLQLSRHFRYMFRQPLTDMNLPPQCLPSFVQLCVDIDAKLICDKLGFHWVNMCADSNALCWYWRVSGNGDACVGVFEDESCSTFVLAHPKGDPNYAIRQVIGERVKRAMQEAMLVGSIYERLQVTLKPLAGSAS